ncbi:hypothetical protein [Cumulibacter manganitolerans]|uniref:hypothetical protein n=1 Tax=Cumulibacter manganitolerans TaxID=1884992 RepID=UPI0012968C04|nr:hypothetical protein [Cumulibacter manganitolerans]
MQARVSALLPEVDARLRTGGPPPSVVANADDPAIAGTGLAAVTVAGTGGSRARLVVDPSAVAGMPAAALDVLVAHELVHVRLQPLTAPSAPLWMAEGFADLVALDVTGADPAGFWAAARSGAAPSEPPADAAFHAASPARDAAYAQAWALWRVLADDAGMAAAREIYLRCAADPGAFDSAVTAVLGLGRDAVLSTWTSALEATPR